VQFSQALEGSEGLAAAVAGAAAVAAASSPAARQIGDQQLQPAGEGDGDGGPGDEGLVIEGGEEDGQRQAMVGAAPPTAVEICRSKLRYGWHRALHACC
jgi:hypothetical protein